MTEKNPATEQATTVEAQSVTAHSVSEKAVFETEKSGASTSDKRAAIKQALRPQLRRTSVVEDYAAELDEMASLTHALNGSKKDDNKSDAWKIGYPYDTKLGRKAYEKEKRALQIELLKLQLWAKATGQKILIIFEGRDAAGKGGSIKRFTEHLNPRGARVVALEKPTDIEQTQWYFQRYIKHLPSGGEIVMMDRSWYNRAGVERVMGYCTQTQYFEFMREVPDLERMLVNSGIKLIKFWFSVTKQEQLARFNSRRTDPVRQWKLSPTDLEALPRWEDYSRAKDEMFVHTDIDSARWHVVESADKRKARINMIHHLLESIPYEHVERPEMTFPKKSSLPSSGYRRTDRTLQHEVPDYAATLSEAEAPECYVDLEDQGIG